MKKLGFFVALLATIFVVGCAKTTSTSEDVKSWQQQGTDGEPVQSDPNGG
ncbi:hypothetical protein QPK87_37750 [Kamptonema cortianum]|nr:hypothetical protein [Geitlerinema splendidum]MDK3162253.1 hypothetical protein [Kamptonema cortianum]